MATFTIQDDLTVREHLRRIAGEFRKRYQGTQWQGDWENADTNETYGDRLQVPTRYTTPDGTRYFLVLNLLVARQSGGKLSARVSAWRLSEVTGEPVGSWPVTARSTSVKGGRLHGTYLVPEGFVERVSGRKAHFDIVRRLPHVMADAKAMLDAGIIGRPVQVEHGYSPDSPLYGETYDTGESHLLPFGGYAAVAEKLSK